MEEKKFPWKKLIKFFIIFTIVICSFLLYSRYIGTSGLKIKEYRIENKKLSEDFYGLKIVHISDIHYGRTINRKELKVLVDEINSTKPDIVVFTGDLVDKDVELSKREIEFIGRTLNSIDATIGKYAITGNHDYKFKNWDILLENSGFQKLDNTYELIYTNKTDCILLSGVSTNTYGKKTINDKLKKSKDLLNKGDIKPNYTILIMHEPDFIDKIQDIKFDLVLAGHSHNGQVRLPFVGAIVKPTYAQKYYDNYYKVKTTDFYISSGLGTSRVNFRLFNRPSFNLYRLTNR